MKTKNEVNSLDIWSGIHFFGSYFLGSIFFALFGLRGLLIAFLMGLLWEIADGIWKIISTDYELSEPHKFDNIFDRRGFSWLDLVLDFNGIVVYYFINLI
jgi:hypothetical protein